MMPKEPMSEENLRITFERAKTTLLGMKKIFNGELGQYSNEIQGIVEKISLRANLWGIVESLSDVLGEDISDVESCEAVKELQVFEGGKNYG